MQLVLIGIHSIESLLKIRPLPRQKMDKEFFPKIASKNV